MIGSLRQLGSRILRPGPGESLQSRSLGFGITTLATRGAGLALLLLSNIVLARILGGSEFGIYSFGTVLTSIVAQVATLGIGASSIKFLPRYALSASTNYHRGFILFSLWGSAASGLVVAGLVGAICYALPDALAVVTPILPALLALIVVQSVNITLIELMRALTWPVHAIFLNVVIMPCLIMAGAYGLWSTGGADARTTAWLTVVSYALVVVAQLLSFLRRVRTPSFVSSTASYEAGRWIGTGLPIVLALAVSQVTFYVDTTLVGIYLSTEQLGTYRVVSQVANTLVLLPGTIYTAIGGLLSREFIQMNREAFTKTLNQVHGLIFLPVIVLAILLMLASKWVLSLFGPSFEDGQIPLIITIAAWLIRLALGPSDLLLVLAGREQRRLLVESAALVVSIFVGLALIPRFGLVGAATAHAVTWLGSAIVLHVLVIRSTGIRVAWYKGLRRS